MLLSCFPAAPRIQLPIFSWSAWPGLLVAVVVGCSIGCQPSPSNSTSSAPPARPSQIDSDHSAEKFASPVEAGEQPFQPNELLGGSSGSDQPGNYSTTATRVLFDGRSLEGWQETPFGGNGECRVEDGVIVLEPGFPLTGITTTRDDLPTNHYEILIEARKTDGIDFFCGLTFPVNDTHCSLIVGGWAGSLVGLSSIDGHDAAHNETQRFMKFERNQWYSIQLRVQSDRIQAWIDKQLVVDQVITDRQLSVRNETLPSRPLGICSFETRAEIRRIEIME
jgi:hypothetical protein